MTGRRSRNDGSTQHAALRGLAERFVEPIHGKARIDNLPKWEALAVGHDEVGSRAIELSGREV